MTRAALALAVTIALFVPADAAKAGFRINHSMEGITPGMSQADVRERLGRPARRERGPDFLNWHYRRPALELTFKPRVITLFTRSPFIRGPGDTGVGTHERRLRRVVPRLRCDTAEGQRRCVVGGFETGQRSTVFVIRRRQVTSITIAIRAP